MEKTDNENIGLREALELFLKKYGPYLPKDSVLHFLENFARPEAQVVRRCDKCGAVLPDDTCFSAHSVQR